MYRLRRLTLRFVVVWLIEAMSLQVMASIVPGIEFAGTELVSSLSVAMAVALVLGFINVLIRPVLLLLTLPINVLSLGMSTLFLNAGILMLTAYILPSFIISSWLAAVSGALVLAVANTSLTSLTTIDDDDSFFQGIVERLSRRQRIESAGEPGRGIVMLEIDGLSYSRLKRAAELGLMPTVRDMLREGHCAVSCVDCGLPSQTSACQAGIMYGDNYDIPAFRWYIKERGKMIVSNNFRDIAELNGRYATGKGLLRGGSSISNLMAGDAAKTLLTLSTLSDTGQGNGHRREEDLYLFFLNPYLFTRSIVLTLADVLLEFGQAIRQRLRNVQPRLNRLKKGYPFLRALSNVFLRDLSTYMVTLDVIRGVPAIYTTYLGYDEVAHHAGPDTPDAMNTLRALDRQIRRVLDVIARKAARPYDVFVLSDHGQSFGATFKQRYGCTLTEFIDRSTAPGTNVAEISVTEIGASYTAALVAELNRVEQHSATGRIGRATVGRARKALQKRIEPGAAHPSAMNAGVIVCASGNLANVYFDLHTGKVSLNELNAAYPGLVDALVMHEGIGLVVTYDDESTPIVLGKGGARDLQTGIVTGADPLRAYGDPQVRAAQLLRLAEFPNAGDLILNSTIYPDGQVAAFEELIGSHGGLGGEQTDAFLLHPSDMVVRPTFNSADVFALLSARRGLPAQLPAPERRRTEVEAWTLSTLVAGIRNWRAWVPLAGRAMTLDRTAYHKAAHDAYATGPALILALAATIILTLTSNASQPMTPTKLVEQFVANGIGLVVLILLTHIAGRVLGGQGELTPTFRALAFAHATRVFQLLGLIPVLGSLFRAAGTLITFLATWLALQESMHLRGWRAALFPLVIITIVVLTAAVSGLIFSGVQFTLEAVLLRLGFAPGR